jgi:HNH endonuclease
MDSKTREFVRQRAGSRCEYCHLPEEADEWPFHLEHIVAKQHGGKGSIENLCWACSRCNLFKGPNLSSVDSETAQRVDLFDPRTQVWSDHFIVRESRIVGTTPVGRATTFLLRMNDGRRLELRAALIRRREFHV